MQIPALAREIRIVDRTGGLLDPADLDARRVAVYGAGGLGRSAAQLLRARSDARTRVVFFVDAAAKRFAGTRPQGLEVLDPQEFSRRRDEADLVLIASHAAAEIAARLEAMGVTGYCTARPLDWLDPLEPQRLFYSPSPGLALLEARLNGGTFTARLRAENGGPLRLADPTHGATLEAGTLRVPLSASGKPRSQALTLLDPETGEAHRLTLTRSQGHAGREVTQFFGPTLHHRRDAFPESWFESMPDAEDAAFLQHRVQKSLPGTPLPGDAYGAARMLARVLLGDLGPHRGLPADPLAAPVDVYRAALAGQERVDCGILARTFRLLCAAHGVPCRLLTLEERRLDGVTLTPGHAFNEVHCARAGHWIFMDPACYVLGARLAGDVLLSYPEFQSLFATPRHRAVEFDFLSGPGIPEFRRSALETLYRQPGQHARVHFPDNAGRNNIARGAAPRHPQEA